MKQIHKDIFIYETLGFMKILYTAYNGSEMQYDVMCVNWLLGLNSYTSQEEILFIIFPHE